MGLRREAREFALQIMYAIDSNPSLGLLDTLQTFREEQPEISEKTRAFAESLVRGVQEKRGEIDAAIKSCSKNWSLSRMPRVDLNVMRLATYELMFRADIPKKVTINEAIEIVRRFGDKDSPSFVNGILDEIKPCEKVDTTEEEQ
jgi:transcription antitermination protein NusB